MVVSRGGTCHQFTVKVPGKKNEAMVVLGSFDRILRASRGGSRRCCCLRRILQEPRTPPPSYTTHESMLATLRTTPRLASKRCWSSFAGPRVLDEVLKTELVADKSGTEVADLWKTYHQDKVCVICGIVEARFSDLLGNQEDVLGRVQSGTDGKLVLERAHKW